MFAESRLHDKRCQLCLDALSLNIADEMTSLFVPFGAYGLAACTCFESLNQERENSAIVLVISEQFRCTGLKVLQSIGCTVSYRLQNLLCPDSQIRVRTTSYENLFLPGRVREQHFRRWPLRWWWHWMLATSHTEQPKRHFVPADVQEQRAEDFNCCEC